MSRSLMIISLCAMFLSIGCESHKEKKEEKSKFLVTSPIRKDTLIVNQYVAQIQSIRNIEMRAQERGYLEKIYVDEGQLVKKGQLMFKIMPKLYNAELQKAKAEAHFAQIEYQNTKQLADSNVVAPNELAMAKAKYEKAQAEQSLAQVHLDFTEIRAPFDGIVDRLHLKLGSLVDEGELLTSLSDNSDMWVYYNVPEAEYLDYKQAIHEDDSVNVELLMANNQIYNHDGFVETIEGEFNNETGNIAFRANFPNPEGLLRHGETGSVLTKVPFKNSLLIPQKATFEVLSKHYVYVVNEDHKIEPREISLAGELPHIYAVNNGVTVDDKILLEGLRKVRDGDEIEYDFEDPQEVIDHLQLYAE
ncbi:efflux RND transporter periplasmic adaptor subunit [Zunongwangia endophytica]|uniref:Efflux RND transporter periplasmic adaptor subunit n=1 Tax=Zunongwangia endophytica TaxID=1808945 RepID=A0ABV8HCT2_9FLAO|nr:efflux RND transporter periplasmic adaptor subunit [Zunongwangia endophytica]MDN3593729.1 efflux RND transporter periplasmic adaptor subunit [Zunongwangia endophytica]